MFNLTPVPIEVLDFYDDGQETRHYRFRLMDADNSNKHVAWHKAQNGQFFMLCLPGIGEAPFTFTQLPNETGEFRALVRKVGSVTHALFNCSVGDVIGARGPFGRGWPVDDMSKERLLIVAGGCGIAPLASLINRLIDTQSFTQLEVVYAARSRATLMLNPERERWQHCVPFFTVVEDMTGLNEQEFYSGTAVGILPKVLHAFAEQPDRVMLAGPEGMMEAAAEYLTAYGVDPKVIYLSVERRMHCAVGLCGHCYLQSRYVCTDGPTFTWAELLPLHITED